MLHYQFDWAIITSGKYAQWILSGFYTTVELSAVSIVLAFLLGLLIAIMRMSSFQALPLVCPGISRVHQKYSPAGSDVFLVFRIVQILPQVVNDWLGRVNFEFAAGAIALTIYTSAFIAEALETYGAVAQHDNGVGMARSVRGRFLGRGGRLAGEEDDGEEGPSGFFRSVEGAPALGYRAPRAPGTVSSCLGGMPGPPC